MPNSVLIRRSAQWACAVLAGVIFLVAIAPLPDTVGGPSDKANHFIAFYVLGLSGALAFPRIRLRWFVPILAVYGALIEGVQSLPAIGRNAELLDWIVDVAAAGCAIVPLALSGLRNRAAADKPGS